MFNLLFFFVLFLFATPSFATKQVVDYFSHTPVVVCQPSDTNTHCGGSNSGGTPGGSQGNIQFLDVQGTVTAFGGNAGFFYSGTGSTAGNVGIGSITPGQKLDVQGTIRTTGFILTGNGAASGFILQTSGSTGIGTWVPAPTGGGSGTVTSVTLATPNSTLTLGGTNPVTTSGTINADINLTNANTWTGQQIFNTSNVGVNSSTPGQRLDVQGTVRSTQMIDTGLTASKVIFTDANKQLISTGIGTSSQFLKGDSSLDSSTYLTGNQSITLSGDTTGSGTTAITTTLKNTGSAGTYRSTTFDAQGRETSGTNPTTFAGYGLSDSSTNLRAALTDSTGTGSAVFATAPNFTANVGIGSASPGQTLDVQGSVRVTGFILNTTGSNGQVLTRDGGGGTYWATPTSGSGSGTVNSGTTGQAAYYASSTNAVSGNSDLVFVGANVGIASVAPGDVLDVQGTIRANNIGMALDVEGTLKMNNLAVFGSEYNNSGNIGIGTTTINWNNGNNQNIGIGTSSGAYIAFTHPSVGGVATLQLRILEDATGSRKVDFWPSTVLWSGGTAPTLSGAAKSDFVNCFWNGTKDYCQAGTNF